MNLAVERDVKQQINLNKSIPKAQVMIVNLISRIFFFFNYWYVCVQSQQQMLTHVWTMSVKTTALVKVMTLPTNVSAQKDFLDTSVRQVGQ